MSYGQERRYGDKNVSVREPPPKAIHVEAGALPTNTNRETGGCMTGTRQPLRQARSVDMEACLLAQAFHRPASRGHDSLARNRGAPSQCGSSRTATDGSPARAERKLEDESAAATRAYRAGRAVRSGDARSPLPTFVGCTAVQTPCTLCRFFSRPEARTHTLSTDPAARRCSH